MEAASWVHAQLDRQFCEHMGEHGLLTDLFHISRALQPLSAYIKQLIEDTGNKLALPSTFSSLVSPVTGLAPYPTEVSILGNCSDIMSLALIVPSLFMAVEANSLRKKRESLLQKIKENPDLPKEELKALKKECRDLNVEEVEKAAAAATNIVGVLSSFSNTVLSLHQLISEGTPAVTSAAHASPVAITAATSFSALSGICYIVAGGIELGIDSSRIQRSEHKKQAIKDLFNNLEQAVDDKGKKILQEEDLKLLHAVLKMQLREINQAIASTSIGLGADLSLLGAGGISLAMAGGVACPPALIVIPVSVSLAIGAKVGKERAMKRIADKQQEAYLLTDPSRSDIGIIHALRHRIQKEDPGSRLIIEGLIKGFYKMSTRNFLALTEGFDQKYAELELTAKRTII
jgi:predicted HAD superfamily Cof-like phosphohydrolase